MSLEFGSISDDWQNITIPKSTSKIGTGLNVVYAKNGRVVVDFTDSDGYTLIGESVIYAVNSGTTQTQTTDLFDHIFITNFEGAINLKVNYAG